MLKREPIRSKAIRESARGERCTLRLPGCDHGTETTVLAHLRCFGGGGMGMKPDDFGVYACRSCHDQLDGRARSDYSAVELRAEAGRALFETLRRLYDKGLLEVR